jgi:hypothetical protein
MPALRVRGILKNPLEATTPLLYDCWREHMDSATHPLMSLITAFGDIKSQIFGVPFDNLKEIPSKIWEFLMQFERRNSWSFLILFTGLAQLIHLFFLKAIFQKP